MTVNAYLFQSPYTQPVQIGRPDPSMLKERAEESREQNNQIEKNTHLLSESQNLYKRSDMAIKSSVAYAQSEGYGISREQVQKLSDVSMSVKRNELANVYG